jgi:hypothetical protein
LGYVNPTCSQTGSPYLKVSPSHDIVEQLI